MNLIGNAAIWVYGHAVMAWNNVKRVWLEMWGKAGGETPPE